MMQKFVSAIGALVLLCFALSGLAQAAQAPIELSSDRFVKQDVGDVAQKQLLAQMNLLTGAGGTLKRGPSGPTFTFAGSDGGNPATTAFTSTTINIGAATSDRFVIVGATDQNNVALTSVTVNGVSLAQDCNDTGGGRIWSGLVGTAGGAGAATIVSTYTGAAFTDRAQFVYVGRGMTNTAGASTTGTQSAGGTSFSINVTAGDLLVGINKFTVTYGSSTVAPTASNTRTYGAAGNSSSPWWNTIASTNASFTVGFSASTRGCAATYH